jgi:hypothetical protein
MQLWDDDKLEELIQEAELCDSKLPRSYAPKTEDEAISIFSRLILQGKIREAVPLQIGQNQVVFFYLIKMQEMVEL